MTCDRGAFSTRHRIIDTAGAVHEVVVVGDQFCDEADEVIGTHGFYVDVTPALTRGREEMITAKVAAIAERRSAIDHKADTTIASRSQFDRLLLTAHLRASTSEGRG